MQKSTTSLLNLSFVDTPIGVVLAGANESNLLFLQYIDEKFKDLYINKAKKLINPSRIVFEDSPPIITIRLELQEYFQGTLKDFKTPIDVIGTAFQQLSWSALTQIPYGDTWSYSEQAKFMGSNTISQIKQCKELATMPIRLGEELKHAAMFKNGSCYNRAYRAVGSANGRNNLMIIIPCHRVIRKDRALGGFAAGIERKQWLLSHESRYK